MDKRGKFFVALVCTGLVAPAGGWAEQPPGGKINVVVDARVELMSIIFRLAGNPEYNTAPNYPYVAEVEAHFRKFKDHPAVLAARELRARDSVSFDAVISMALHLADGFELKERVPLDLPPEKLDRRWKLAASRDFLAKARQFVKDTKFKEFIEDHQKFYRRTADRLRKRLAEREYLSWFDEFFGARPTAKFHAIAGMLNGSHSYGPSVKLPDGSEEIYMVLGVGRADADGMPQFGKGLVGLVVHEYCHSYVNHVVDKHFDALVAAGDKIFPQVEEAMSRQAYGNWQTVMREACVRACTVRYLLKTDGQGAARQAIDYEHGRSFLWTAELVDVLQEYESNRDKYATFDSFFPRIVEFFNAYAERHADGKEPLRTDLYGPINEALSVVQRSSGSAVVRPDKIKDDDLRYRMKNFVTAVHERFYAAKGVALVTAEEARDKKLHDKALVLYGSPKSNALLKDIAAKCGIVIRRNQIKLGDKVFEGKGLVLITCYPNPYNPEVPVLLYTSADDEKVINLNDFFHGPTDYLVGRWTDAGQAETLFEGNYRRASSGQWVVPTN